MMRLIEQFERRPVWVAFGRSPEAGSGPVNFVGLDTTRDADSVTITADDGSFVVIPAPNGVDAGVMTAADKIKLDGLDPGAGEVKGDFETAAAVAAAVVSPALGWLRTQGFHAVGDGGGGLYARVGTDPGHGLVLTDAAGAFFELVPQQGVIDVRQAGAKGDGVTDDWAAFDAAVKAFAGFGGTATRVRVPATPDGYLLNQTLEIKTTVVLEGDANGYPAASATALLFPADVTGIIVQYDDTIGAGRDPMGATTAGTGSILRGLFLKGGGGAFGSADGIWLRARARIESCAIERFSGDGIRIEATVGSADDAKQGNANLFVLESVLVQKNQRHGLHVAGSDVNAGTVTALDARENGRWGVAESSFLGNTYVGLHTSTNGVARAGQNGDTGSSVVSHNGLIYAAEPNATEVALAATVPGTDAAVWVETGSGGPTTNIPAWQAAQPAGTYFTGGPVRSDGLSARNTFLNPYAENGQAPAYLQGRALAFGGLLGPGVSGSGNWQDGERLRGSLEFVERDEARALSLTLRPENDDTALARAEAEGDHPTGYNILRWNEMDGGWDVFRHGNLDTRVALTLTTDLTNLTFGRSTPPAGGRPVLPNGMFLGDGDGARHHDTAAAAPTTGEHARGDIVWNRNPSPGGFAGWICTAGGMPGSWKGFGAIET